MVRLKNSKNKIVFIILICLLVIGIVLWLIFKPKKNNETPKENNTTSVEEFKGFNFKDITKLEYGFGLNDLVDEVICTDKCFYQDRELDYTITEVKSLGTQEIKIKINYQDKNYEHTYQVEVVDTTKPDIKLLKKEDFITVGDKFDALKYIESVTDNFDKIEIKDVQIDSKVNPEKVGEYKVTYMLSDSNKNEAKEELIIKVKAKDTTNSTKPNNATSSNNNKPNNSSSSNENTNSNLKNDINSVKLQPIKTRYAEVDNKVSSIISSVTKSGMSNYDKLVAIYDYVKSKYTYEMSVLNLNTVKTLMNKYHYSYDDAIFVYNAYYILSNKSGVCDNYSALFMIMARRIGFDAYVVGGEAPRGNSRGGHAWVLIRANGKNYFFDPQIENRIKGKYSYFGKTEAEKKGFYSNYNLKNSMAIFKQFKDQGALTVGINISGAATASATLKSDSTSTHTDSLSIDLGQSITIKLSFKGSNSYSYRIYTTKENLKKGESKGEDITFDYNPTSDESQIINVTVTSPNTSSVTYKIQLNILDRSKIKMFGSYSYFPFPSGLVQFEFFPYGGYAPYTYKMDILETDATEGYNVDASNSKYLYLTPGNGTYFKFKVTVKDSKKASYSETFNYDVKNKKLKSLK